MLGLRWFTLFLVGPAAGVPNIAKAGADTATLAESATVTVTLVASDTGTETDTGEKVSDIDVIKTGADAFALSLEEGIVFSIPGEDFYLFKEDDTTITSDDSEVFGTLEESFVLTPVVTATDPFSLAVESGAITLVTVKLERTDTATLAENGRVGIDIPASDTATLAEAAEIDEITGALDVDIAASDTLTLAESALAAKPATASDAFTLAEASQRFASGETTLDNDTGTLAEIATVAVTVVASDTATLAELATVTVSHAVTDVGTMVDALETLTAAVVATDPITMSQVGDNGQTLGELLGTVTLFAAAESTVTLEPALDAGGTLFGAIDGAIGAGV